MSDYGRGLRAVLKIFPEDYRKSHAAEIITTLCDAQEQSTPRLTWSDLLSLAVAGTRIRARSLGDAEWRTEIDRGIALGMRGFFFFLAIGAAAFLWLTVIHAQSIYGGYGYSDGSRLLFAFVLVPWIGVFVGSLWGWWRIATVFAATSGVATLWLVGHKIADPFGVGVGTAAAITMVGFALVFVRLGWRMQLSRIQSPALVFSLWAVAAMAFTAYPQDSVGAMARPVVVIGVILSLFSAGMATAGKSRGLVACGMLLIPGWMMSAGVFYFGGSAPFWFVEFGVWTILSVVASITCLYAAIVIARRVATVAADESVETV